MNLVFPLVNAKGEVHPTPNSHPHGEWRSWCRKCGEPTWTDDVAFATYHVGLDGRETRLDCAALKR